MAHHGSLGQIHLNYEPCLGSVKRRRDLVQDKLLPTDVQQFHAVLDCVWRSETEREFICPSV